MNALSAGDRSLEGVIERLSHPLRGQPGHARAHLNDDVPRRTAILGESSVEVADEALRPVSRHRVADARGSRDPEPARAFDRGDGNDLRRSTAALSQYPVEVDARPDALGPAELRANANRSGRGCDSRRDRWNVVTVPGLQAAMR